MESSTCQDLSPSSSQKKIRRRKIIHGNIKKTRPNKNCPKFILGYCWLNFRDRILKEATPQEEYYIRQSFEMVEGWIGDGSRDNLTISHIKQLMGAVSEQSSLQQCNRKYLTARVFYRFLANNLADILTSNKRVTKILAYFICLQKFTSRLGNPSLLNKLEFK